MKWIPLDNIITLHKKMIRATGGLSGIRDINLLQSAIFNAQATFDGIDLYPNLESKCAAVCYGVINNHPFVDGNKRMGIYLLLILLEYNDYIIEYSEDELVELGFGIAKDTISRDDIVLWIKKHDSSR